MKITLNSKTSFIDILKECIKFNNLMTVELNKYDNTLIFKNKSVTRDKFMYKSVDLSDFMTFEYSQPYEEVFNEKTVILLPIQNLLKFVNCLSFADTTIELTVPQEYIEKPYDKGDLLENGYKYVSAQNCVIKQECVEIVYSFGMINMFDYMEIKKLKAIVNRDHGIVEISAETNHKLQELQKMLTKDQHIFVTKQPDGIVFHPNKDMVSSEWRYEAFYNNMSVLEHKELIPESFILASKSVPAFQGKINLVSDSFIINVDDRDITVYAYSV